MGSMGSEADWGQLDPDFAAGKKALVAEDWNGAIAALKLAALRDPRNADIQNYIGYAYRRLRQLGPAMQHYQQAILLEWAVCTENSIRVDYVTESPNVSGDDRAVLPLPGPVRLAVQVEEPT